MRILSRCIGETLKIGDDIKIQILDVDRHGQVRIGINAPKHINIVRSELLGRPCQSQASETAAPTAHNRQQPTVRILRRRSLTDFR